HLDDPLAFLVELARVLKPRATLMIAVPMEFPWVVWNDYTHARGFTRAALALLLEDAGYEVVRISPTGGVPLFGRLGWGDRTRKVAGRPGLRPLRGRWGEGVARRVCPGGKGRTITPVLPATVIPASASPPRGAADGCGKRGPARPCGNATIRRR